MPKAAAEKKEKAPAKEKKEKAPAKEKKPRAPPKEKKGKGKKDPNAPKKAIGAYMWFCKDKRPGIKEAHPEWGLGEIGREMGAQWKKVSEKEKKKYEDLAAKDKERFQKESAAYKPAKEVEEEEEEEEEEDE